jgi:hypothetical protein
MAKLTVEGTVGRIFFAGKGVEIHEQIDTPTMSFVKKYTAWFYDPVNFVEGARGTITGNLKTKIEDWLNEDGTPKLDREGKAGRSIKIELNDTTFTTNYEIKPPVLLDDATPF